MTTESTGVDREKVARIIDPEAWDMSYGMWSRDEAQATALSKADAILALLPTGEAGEGGRSRSQPGYDECSLASAEAEPSAAMGVEYPQTAQRSPAPGLERWAENQRPKTADHEDARLYRYLGTDLYQWYSRRSGSVFHDPCDVPFLIARKAASTVKSNSAEGR